MDPIAYWVGLAVAAFGGGFLKDLIKWIRDSIRGRNAARRDEVARAFAERDKAIKERDAARSTSSWWERWARVLDEAFLTHRRRMIDAGLAVDPYPARPAKD